MPNIAFALKTEISRVARKEVRGETLPLKKAVGLYRAEIAALKRRAEALERTLRHLANSGSRKTPSVPEKKSRFSAKSLASQRRRLGLSAEDCGRLIGASAQSIYNWEEGKIRPHPRHLPAIAALRTLGRRAARAHLDSVKG